MKTFDTDHTFALCAYGQSPYLEHCIRSLLGQSVGTNIIISTSTPNDRIYRMAARYNLPVYETGRKSDIQDDWNFAYNTARTKLVTIAHQDDIYHREYLRAVLAGRARNRDMVMAFTDYIPIKGGVVGKRDANSVLRRILRMPLKFPALAGQTGVKRRCLSLGNSISCPTVTYNKQLLGDNVFTSKLKFSLDWDTFEKLSRVKGKFVYIDRPLVCYRVHDGATTKEFITTHKREREDMYMFRKFWPEWAARLIMKFYVRAYDTYRS